MRASNDLNSKLLYKSTNTTKQEVPSRLIDKKVIKVLTRLYRCMKDQDHESHEVLTGDKKSFTSDFTLNTPQVTQITQIIPRISSFSPDRKRLVLPERSIGLYTKLNAYYTRKCTDVKKQKAKKIENAVKDHCNLSEKGKGWTSIQHSPIRSPSPRVPSLLIRL